MPRIHSSNSRFVRLTAMQYHLHRNKSGLTTRQLAGLCDSAVRTIQRDLLVLQSDMHVPLERKNGGRWSILQDYVLPPVSCSLYEALVLFLAARLMVRQTGEANPHVQSALLKLISIMPVPLAVQLRKSIDFIGRRPSDPHELDIFEKAALAWVTQRKARIIYHSFHRKTQEEWYINPYFMEMTGVGYSTYLIGYAESGDKMGIYTFKLNRIKEIEVLEEKFENIHQIRMDELLGSSWGVIWGEEVPVVLRFSPSVTRRVKETNWHPSQVIQDQPDGGCLLKMRVSSTLEMTPWIRGWGPDVEVLEPLKLREQMKGWARRLGEMYR
ncbi:MAG: WYL domain-containing protein [Dehalococcoidales bacterium]|nr:WYL domain-containing protein [Dehalococcoidales bacterium]